MIKKIAPDKWKHFLVGILVGAILQAFFLWKMPASPALATILAFVLVVAISYGFELFSKFTGKGHYELMDAIASVVGGMLGMAATLVIKLRLFME